VRPKPAGWSTFSERKENGAIDSEQRVTAPGPVVETSTRGAAELGAVYWREVERFMHGLVVAGTRGDGSIELRLRPGGFTLIRFGPPELTASAGVVRCSYPIAGGLLARRPGGTISFSQDAGPPPLLASAIEGFFPRFGAAPGRASWTGAPYEQVQRRLHLAVSKRFLAALVAGTRS
jgi:hypothetical protein